MNPPSHTWAGDGGESPGDPAGSQATDTNPYSDLSASEPTATADVCSLLLHLVWKPQCWLHLAASRAAFLFGLGISEAWRPGGEGPGRVAGY